MRNVSGLRFKDHILLFAFKVLSSPISALISQSPISSPTNIINGRRWRSSRKFSMSLTSMGMAPYPFRFEERNIKILIRYLNSDAMARYPFRFEKNIKILIRYLNTDGMARYIDISIYPFRFGKNIKILKRYLDIDGDGTISAQV